MRGIGVVGVNNRVMQLNQGSTGSGLEPRAEVVNQGKGEERDSRQEH